MTSPYIMRKGVSSIADLKDAAMFTMAAAGGRVIRVSAKGDGDYSTVQEGINAANWGDVVLIDQAGVAYSGNASVYTESVTMTDKDNISIVGVGPFGSVRIKAAAAGGTAFTMTGCRDINVVNLKLSGLTTGAGLKIDGTGDTRRNYFYDCHFTSGAGGDGVFTKCGTGQVAVAHFKNCLFTESAYGIRDIAEGGGNPTSQIVIEDCGFYYHTAWNIQYDAYAVNINILKCWFGLEEDGTLPTGGFVDHEATNSTGLVAGCWFSDADAGSTEIKLAAEVFFMGNYTEEGCNAARPN